MNYVTICSYINKGDCIFILSPLNKDGRMAHGECRHSRGFLIHVSLRWLGEGRWRSLSQVFTFFRLHGNKWFRLFDPMTHIFVFFLMH